MDRHVFAAELYQILVLRPLITDHSVDLLCTFGCRLFNKSRRMGTVGESSNLCQGALKDTAGKRASAVRNTAIAG